MRRAPSPRPSTARFGSTVYSRSASRRGGSTRRGWPRPTGSRACPGGTRGPARGTCWSLTPSPPDRPVGGFAQLAAAWRAASGTPAFVLGIRLAVAGVFLVAGTHKLRHARETAASIANFRLGRLATVRAAVLLGLLELALAAGL